MGPYYCVIGEYHDNNRYPNIKYRHVKMGLPSREGAISAAQRAPGDGDVYDVRLWDGPPYGGRRRRRRRRGTKKIWRWRAAKIAMVRDGAILEGPSATWVESIKWVLWVPTTVA